MRRMLFPMRSAGGHSWMVTVAPRWLARAKAPFNLVRRREFWLLPRLPRNAPESWLNSLRGETLKTAFSRAGSLLHLATSFGIFPLSFSKAKLESRNPSIESAGANDRIDVSGLTGVLSPGPWQFILTLALRQKLRIAVSPVAGKERG